MYCLFINMITNRRYNENMDTILHYLETSMKSPNYPTHAQGIRDKIRFYMTTQFIMLPRDTNQLMNEILRYELYLKSVIDIGTNINQISLIKNDITQIRADCIVNAANADGMGCFDFNHKCIDNIIHNKAGPNLRLECKAVLNGTKIPTSGVIVTKGYNLPCKFILHTVGPIYSDTNKNLCEKQLANCYVNCLTVAHNNGYNSIVFCCISTGIYGFPSDRAAEIATVTVRNFIMKSGSKIRVIFCTFTDNDYALYQKLL